ncbi:leucine-rich repeat and WD repeat-containing protein 1-like [Glandiceps talaboti]
MKGTGLPRNFTPVHFIRCHSKTNDPDDEDNRVWRCAFEPDPNNKGDTTNIVATCGSDSVCLLDCKSGKVMKKYKQPNEDFYAIAWTTVVMEIGGKETPTNLLAAAGKSCQIRLLYPVQLICYANTPVNKQPINVLLFHPEKPTWLFSGTREAVTLWDIGIPKLPNYGCQPRQLCSFKAVSDVLNLAVLPRTGQRSDRLIGGCDDGIYGWDLDEKIDSKTRQVSVEYLLPSCKQKEEIFVDGLAVVQDDIIATKFSRLTEDDEFVSDSVIHIWNVTETDSQLGKRKTDFEIIPTKVVHSLQWKSINEIYLYLSCRKDSGVVAAGDDKGNIHLYDVSKVTSSKVKGDSIAASQVLDWPSSVLDDDSDYILINHIDISSDLKTIVAVTQNNIVCVWKAK